MTVAKRFKPWAYQKKSIDWIEQHDRCLLILDMGMGKTVSTLTALKNGMFPKDGSAPRFKRPLIIAPLSVAMNTWTSEMAKWKHTKTLKYNELDADNVDLRLQQYDRIKDGTLTIMSESKIQWLVDMLNAESLEDDGREWIFDCVVLDEITLFKNPKSKRFQNLRKKLQNRVDYVIGLTGTPASNSLADLWAIMLLIDRGKRLGTTKKQFNDAFTSMRKIKINGGNQEIAIHDVRKDQYENILDAISDVALAMKKEDWLEQDYTETIVPVPVKLSQAAYDTIDTIMVQNIIQLAEATRSESKDVKRLRRRIERNSRSPDLKKQRRVTNLQRRLDKLLSIEGDDTLTISTTHALAALGKYRQLAGGAVYEDLPDTEDEERIKAARKNRRVYEFDNSKLQALHKIVKRHAPAPILIFYHFKHEAERIQRHYPEAEFINSRNSRKQVKRWNEGKIPILLANPASTKFGLNMQDGGSVAVWYSLSFSFESFVQSNARLGRQGQQNDCFIYLLEALDTVDIKIATDVQTKQRTNTFVYDYLTEGGTSAKNSSLVAAQDDMKDLFTRVTGKQLDITD